MLIRGSEVRTTSEGGLAKAVLTTTLPPPGPASPSCCPRQDMGQVARDTWPKGWLLHSLRPRQETDRQVRWRFAGFHFSGATCR